MNENKQKKQKKKSPGIDLKTATKDEFILFFRDKIKSIEIRKILYPEFKRLAEETQDEKELLDLFKEYLLKAEALKQKEKLEEKKVSISAEKESATENNPNKKNNNNGSNSPVEEKITSISSEEKGTNSVTLERESSTTSTSTNSVQKFGQKSNTRIPSLSVWESIQYYLKNPELKKDDPAFLKRLQLYAKRAIIIINIIDVYQVVNVGEAFRIAREIPGAKLNSRTTMGDLLNNLAADGFLELEILETHRKVETHLYSISGYKDNYPERYNIKKIRHTNGYTRNSLNENLDKQNFGQSKDKLESIKEKAKSTSLAQKEGYAEAREEEKEREEKERIEKQKERVQKAEQLSKHSSPEDSFNVLLYNSVQKLSKEELERSKKSKPFREEYNKMLKQKEGMTKEELESILNLEELRQKRDRDRST